MAGPTASDLARTKSRGDEGGSFGNVFRVFFLQFPELGIDRNTDRPADETSPILVERITSSFDCHMYIIQIDEVGKSILL